MHICLSCVPLRHMPEGTPNPTGPFCIDGSFHARALVNEFLGELEIPINGGSSSLVVELVRGAIHGSQYARGDAAQRRRLVVVVMVGLSAGGCCGCGCGCCCCCCCGCCCRFRAALLHGLAVVAPVRGQLLLPMPPPRITIPLIGPLLPPPIAE